jgi:hypothetical protein
VRTAPAGKVCHFRTPAILVNGGFSDETAETASVLSGLGSGRRWPVAVAAFDWGWRTPGRVARLPLPPFPLGCPFVGRGGAVSGPESRRFIFSGGGSGGGSQIAGIPQPAGVGRRRATKPRPGFLIVRGRTIKLIPFVLTADKRCRQGNKMTPETYYMLWIGAYLLSGAGFYVGASKLLSRKIKKKTAQRAALLSSVFLVFAGLFMATRMYIRIQEVFYYATSV